MVTVTTLKSCEVAQAVNLEPCSPDDWEILELHAEYLEDHFLDQVYVLSHQQVLFQG